MNKIFLNALGYISFLITLTIIFHITKYVIKEKNIKFKTNINEVYLEYLYISFFAIISGSLLFFGFKNLIDAIFYILKNKNLAQVTTSTVVISFAFLLSAYFQDILQELLDVKIKLDVWKNIIGYIIGRIILIGGIYIFQKK